jgi:deoxyribonuclease-4
MVKLKLGYSIGLPLVNHTNINTNSIDENTSEFIENINQIKLLEKNFNCVQIMFMKKKISSNEIKQINLILKNYKQIFVHASYQINIGADLIPSHNDLYNACIETFISEILYAKKINAQGIVIHMGKNVKNQYELNHIYNNMVKFIISLFKKLKEKKIKILILLETPAGQGGEMCWNLNEFVDFVSKFKSQEFYKYLGICVDTCHIFQAGYDLNNLKTIKKIHQILSPIEDKIKLIHLNDSFHQVGMRIDKHEQIGKGHIQIDKLVKFILPYKSVPMILETPSPKKQFDSLADLT